jgi:hypothetical protein
MIEDQTPFIQIVYEEIEEYGLYDHKIKLFNLMEAALNGMSGKARKEIDELWLEIQEYKVQLAIPPTDEELVLRHPTMSV